MPRMPKVPLIAITATLVSLLVTTPANAAAEISSYVALGDSFASGPLIPHQRTDPAGCFRSDHNYAAQLADRLGVTDYTDVSCGGATTANLTSPQPVLFGSNPPQFDALRPSTQLVTLAIGGNDIGFGDIVFTCLTAGLTDPAGAPCQRLNTVTDGDLLANRITTAAPKIAAALKGIHQRSPRAKVVLVAYLRVLPAFGGCWPTVSIAAGDVPYLDGVQRRLHAMFREQAAANQAVLVDPYQRSTGHDVCQPSGVRWVEGVIPTTPAFPMHPNAAGMAQVATLVQGAVG